MARRFSALAGKSIIRIGILENYYNRVRKYPMELNSRFEPPMSPHLASHELPEELRVTSETISDNLSDMGVQAKRLSCAVALFDFCGSNYDNGPLFRDWQMMAAREGAMAVRNFGKAFSRVRELIGKIEPWSSKIHVGGLRPLWKEYAKKFPFADRLRHSVAHPEAFLDASKRMYVKGGITIGNGAIEIAKGGQVQVREMLYNSTYGSTFDGEYVNYDINGESALFICDLTRAAFKIFEPLDPHAQWRSRLS